MAVGIHLTDRPSDLGFAGVHVFSQYTDALDVSGLAAGQSVTVHQILRISGSSSISEPGPPGTFATARTDLTIDGTGIPEGPFFGAFGGPTYATSRHSRPSSHITDRDLGPPDDIDLIFSLTADHGGGFFALLGQCFEIQEHDAGGGIGQHGGDVLGAGRDRLQRFRNRAPKRIGPQHVGLGEIGRKAAFGQGARGAGAQRRAVITGARRDHLVGGNLAGQRRPIVSFRLHLCGRSSLYDRNFARDWEVASGCPVGAGLRPSAWFR